MQLCPSAGTTVFNPNMNGRVDPNEGTVYLNLNERVECSGTVHGWSYRIIPDRDAPPVELILAMYRPQLDGTYQLVPGSYYQLRVEESFNRITKREVELHPSEYFSVQQNDVVAICEELDTSRVEIFVLTLLSRSLWYWNAGGCTESRIAITGRPSQQQNSVFLLSALIGIDTYDCGFT